ncbi:hypothetical protein [Vibrio maritimus]|uniref:Uncharacterized protein n=1 Tax=Vibrio maritimus TaxID=990268 RepID=A0A090RVV9_9VIBR|nr:hypothetical protein JCM19235_6917 [Vibrio maritimus]
MKDTTLAHLRELTQTLESHKHLFNRHKLRAALQGKLPELPIMKREFNTKRGKALHILNTTNQCFTRFNGAESTLIQKACVVTISAIQELSLDTGTVHEVD